MYNVTGTITIEEKDGVITIMGNMPDGFEKSICALLIGQMMEFGTRLLNSSTGQSVKMEVIKSH